jgi:TolB-like protein/Flp pilus assembly protein TadD/predicted Ser/Thr protein kinase
VRTGTSVCGKCAATVPDDARRGLCPACLLETGLGLLGDEPVGGDVHLGRADDARVEDKTKFMRRTQMLGDFGDYELLEEVGRGAQGVVYRARQKSLNRTVALKVIGLGPWATEAHLKRFRREAEAAASLDHPGIVPIHEVGESDGYCYFSMKFVEGGQLDEVVRDGPISTRQAAELIAKVARTVHYAHEHGILHRDIKPGNILLDANGEPHLTDFGLARLVETESTVTRTKEVLGTPSYMAPEQAVGDTNNLTSATDVYGLGAVLYQLLTGQPPFAGGTTYETVKLLLEKEPRPPRLLNPKVDRDLSAICLKCLEKDPKRRYSSSLALAQDLEHWLKHEPIQAKPSGFFIYAGKWVRRNPSTAMLVTVLVALTASLGVTVWNRKLKVVLPKSVAVLPFESLSRDPDNVYFVDGIQDEILTRLAAIADLKVISRTSTQRYQSNPRNLPEIGKQLGVANILEGSVQKAGDQVRVNVQLINAQNDTHLWADTYDRKLTDVFAVESEIANTVADRLKAKLTRSERKAMALHPTANPEAYKLYLKGRFFWRKRTGADLRKAIDYFNHAIAKDPIYALAYAGLADCYDLLDEYSEISPKESYPKAKAAAIKALQLDDTLGEAHNSLAYSLINYDWDWQGAEREYRRAIQLNPNYATAHQWYAEGLSLVGRHTEAIAEIQRAQELDPLSLIINQGVGGKYLYARRYDEAMAQFQRTLELYPTFAPTHQRLGWCYVQKRMYDEAIGEMQKAVELSGNSTQMIAALGYTYAAAGRVNIAQAIIAELERRSKERYVDDYYVATIFAALGDKDEAFVQLNKACAERSYWMPYIKKDFRLDNLRSDSRFDVLIRRVFGQN